MNLRTLTDASIHDVPALTWDNQCKSVCISMDLPTYTDACEPLRVCANVEESKQISSNSNDVAH